jgi:hypothetical protein
VVVEGQQVVPAGERIRLAHQLERPAGVGRENAQVLFGVGVEELEHVLARVLHQFGGSHGGGIAGVRVAEHMLAEHLEMLADLGIRIQAAAGVIEVDLLGQVEPGIVRFAQVIERLGGRVAGVGFQEPDEIRLGIGHTASCLYLTTECIRMRNGI